MKKNDTSDNVVYAKLSSITSLFFKSISIGILFSILLIQNKVLAQQAKVSIDRTNVKLEVILADIEKQTNYLFTYNNEVNSNALVSIKVTNTPVNQVLNTILKGKGIKFEQKGNHIILSPVPKDTSLNKTISITVKNTKIINGQVTDVQGVPLVGVTIDENGVKKGVTDANGNYVVRVEPNSEIAFSSVGKETSYVKVGDDSRYNIILKDAFNNMDELVVTGYQDVNKRDVVGSFQTIKMSDIHMPNYTTVDKMLQGVVPGMIVSNSSSRVGSSPNIQIRGSSTLLGNTSPLWVVDGIIQEDPIEINAGTFMSTNIKEVIGNQVSWLNPMDIESVTVLKDASATAIYGSKASNGVIVITTKKALGKDRIRINYSGSSTVNTKPNYGMFNVMNSQERILFSDQTFDSGVPFSSVPFRDEYTYEGVRRLFIEGRITQEEFNQKRRFFETVNTDWFDLLTRTGVDQNHSLSLTGGSDKITVASSFSFNNQQGQEIGNDGKRYTGRISTGVQIHPKLRLNLSMIGGYTETKSFGTNINPMDYAINTSRSIPAFDEFGNLAYYQKDNTYSYNTVIETLNYNIINERNNSESLTESMRATVNADLRWEIKKWLSYNFTGGYNYTNSSSSSMMGENTFYVANSYRGYDVGTVLNGSEYFKAAALPFGGEYFTNDAHQKSYNIQNKFNLSWNFDNDSRLNVLLGQELRSGTNVSTANTVWGYSKERGEVIISPTLPTDLVPTAGASSYTGFGILGNLYNGRWKRNNQTDNFMSFFATAAYSLKNKYVVNTSVRNDISNRFGQDVNKRFDPTYSFGVSWRIAEEPLVKQNIPQLSQFNLRATYGIQGNALTNQSPELLLYKNGLKQIFNQYYSTISRIPNPNLSWERTSNWNFGADIILFNKISAIVDYYSRRSNAVLSQEIPYEFGYANVNMNGGIIFNKGIEGLLSFTPLNTNDYGLNISLNASRNWNTTGKPFTSTNYQQYLTGRSGFIIKEGYSVDSFWSHSFGGLNPEDGSPIINLLDTDPTLAKAEGPTSYMVYSGVTKPTVTGGATFNFRYKQFTLGTGFSMLLGGHTRLNSPFVSFGQFGNKLPLSEVNVDRLLIDRWMKPGDELYTYIPSINPNTLPTVALPDGSSGKSLLDMWETSDALVVSSSFLRCRNLDLSWRLRQENLKHLKLSSLAFTFSMNNLFVIGSKRFNGLDPELKNSVMPKAFSFGINCGI